MKTFMAALALAVAALTIQPVFAHHSGAGFGKDVKEISGTIKEFQFMNPHSWIQVNVADASGKTTEWSLEWGSPNQLGREGIRPSTFTPGTKVTIKCRPMANGQPVAAFIAAKMPDGSIVGKWDATQ